jgi:hypothetical protein
MTLTGGCLCCGVRYEIEGQIFEISNCHCSRCRKQSGSAFLSFGGVATKNLRWISGEDLIARFDSSPGVRLYARRHLATAD